MTLRQILDFVNFTSNKSQEGNALSSDEFNTLISTFNMQIFEEEFAAVEMQAKAQGLSVYELLYTNSSLRPFRVKTNVSTALGVATLPTNYSNYITFLAKFGAQERVIEVVSERVMNIKRTSLAESSPSISPVVTIYSDSMQFLPKTLGVENAIEMVYLKKPNTPFYDECVADDGLRVYMPVGSYIEIPMGSLSPRPNLYAANRNPIANSVYHPIWEGYKAQHPDDDTEVITYTSRTVELEWEERKQLVMIDLLTQAIGINTRTQLQAK